MYDILDYYRDEAKKCANEKKAARAKVFSENNLIEVKKYTSYSEYKHGDTTDIRRFSKRFFQDVKDLALWSVNKLRLVDSENVSENEISMKRLWTLICRYYVLYFSYKEMASILLHCPKENIVPAKSYVDLSDESDYGYARDYVQDIKYEVIHEGYDYRYDEELISYVPRYSYKETGGHRYRKSDPEVYKSEIDILVDKEKWIDFGSTYSYDTLIEKCKKRKFVVIDGWNRHEERYARSPYAFYFRNLTLRDLSIYEDELKPIIIDQVKARLPFDLENIIANMHEALAVLYEYRDYYYLSLDSPKQELDKSRILMKR